MGGSKKIDGNDCNGEARRPARSFNALAVNVAGIGKRNHAVAEAGTRRSSRRTRAPERFRRPRQGADYLGEPLSAPGSLCAGGTSAFINQGSQMPRARPLAYLSGDENFRIGWAMEDAAQLGRLVRHGDHDWPRARRVCGLQAEADGQPPPGRKSVPPEE